MLFKSRKAVKKQMAPYADKKEEMEAENIHEKDGIPTQEYVDVLFELSLLNSRQLAKKVHMNTFYGETGNPISPIHEVLVAGGITSDGQYNIKLVADYCKKNGKIVKYGDTDSVYVVCEDSIYEKHTKEYESGNLTRMEYYTLMVEETMKNLSVFVDQINNMLKKDNNTDRLKIAYEEVLFPAYLAGKKKYWGIPHEKIPNFFPKKLFIRGIDVIKQSVSELTKKFGLEVMWEAVCIDPVNRKLLPYRDMETIIINKLEVIYKTIDDLPLEYFKQTAKYRPDKKNVRVLTCIDRMRYKYEQYKSNNNLMMAALYQLPDPGERFTFVYVKRDCTFDLKGRRVDVKAGDIMEFPQVYTYYKNMVDLGKLPLDQKLSINVDKYIESGILGLFGRFLCYKDEFNDMSIEVYKERDNKSVNLAKKYVGKLCDKFSSENKSIISARQKIAKNAISVAKKSMDLKIDTYYTNIIMKEDEKIKKTKLKTKLAELTKIEKFFGVSIEEDLEQQSNKKLIKNLSQNPNVNLILLAIEKKVHSDISRKSLKPAKDLLKKIIADWSKLNKRQEKYFPLIPSFNYLNKVIDDKYDAIELDYMPYLTFNWDEIELCIQNLVTNLDKLSNFDMRRSKFMKNEVMREFEKNNYDVSIISCNFSCESNSNVHEEFIPTEEEKVALKNVENIYSELLSLTKNIVLVEKLIGLLKEKIDKKINTNDKPDDLNVKEMAMKDAMNLSTDIDDIF